jgi:riboflavin synthase
MFTGIVESLGEISNIVYDQSNIHFEIKSKISSELRIDQSVSHDGICLTVTNVSNNIHSVTAINETLQITNLKNWSIGKFINLERCMIANGRFDGHLVQGHVDTTAVCDNIKDENGSWLFTFKFKTNQYQNYIVKKGSICINGTSLTVVDCCDNFFSVAIIPYTFENTSFNKIAIGSIANIEFDIIGKYVEKMLQSRSIL